MKTQHNLAYWLGLVLACGLVSAPGARAQDQQVILHPGTITGEIKIMDPDNPGVPLPISYLTVRATASTPSNYYYAYQELRDSNRYTLTVEAGPWRYSIMVLAQVPKLSANPVMWNFSSVLVGERETVTKDFQTDAFVDVQLNIGSATIGSIGAWAQVMLNPSNSFSISLSRPNNRAILPVCASDYRPHAVGAIGYMDNGCNRLRPEENTNVVVSAGQTVSVVFAVDPGYIEGTVTCLGVTPYWGYVRAVTAKTETNSAGMTEAYIYPRTGNQIPFRFPCIPALRSNVVVSCELYTGNGYRYGTRQYPDVLAGQTTICNWEFNFTGSIAGKVSIAGFPIKSPGYSYVTGWGANGGSQIVLQEPSDGTFRFTGLGEGLYNVGADQRIVITNDVVGAVCTQDVYYAFYPSRQVQLPAGGSASSVDFTLTPGFITGRLLDPNSAALPLLYYSEAKFAEWHNDVVPPLLDYSTLRARGTASSPSQNPRPEVCNTYWTVANSGSWQFCYFTLKFQSNAVDGVALNSVMEGQDRRQVWPDTGATWNVPAQTVQENATSTLNLDYKTGLVRIHLRVSDGRPLSSPSAYGRYFTNSSGIQDKSLQMSGSSAAANVAEGIVHLYGLPGTYQVTAQASVAGSTTTFGQPFFVTIGAGDVVDQDPDGPIVGIQFPPGEYVTCGDSVVVTGTVTDVSGVGSFTINGQSVALDAQGNFNFTMTGLVVGNNTIHLVATDTHGKVTSVDRTVIRNGIPIAVGDAYSLYDDETLKISAPGVLANDTDPDAGAVLSAAVLLGPLHGSLNLGPNGAFIYTPNQGFAGMDAFTYTVTDGRCGSGTARASIEVKARNRAPVIVASTASVHEDTPLTVTVATDPDNDPLTVTITGGVANGTATFTGAVLTYMPALNFNGTDTISFTVSDGRGGVTSGTLAITVLPVNDPPVLAPLTLSANSITENDSVKLSGSFTDPDLGDTHTVSIDWSDGSSSTLPLATGVLSFLATHRYLDDNPTGTPADVYAIAVTVTDAGGLSDTGSTSLTVNNAAPVITSLSAPVAPVPVSQAPTVTVQFTDVGTLDTHSVTFAWGDGTSTAATPTAGSASAAHTYAVPGVYTVTITVTDDDTGTASQSTPYVVMYDPTGSFVTGGGWIQSPPGAYVPDPTLTGRAHFGFVSRYEKGATVPSGKTDFRFVTANLDFHSTAYDWLVVAGMKAMFKGVGTINGSGDYGFILTAWDGNAPGQTDVDRFRIQIWDRATGATVYDNQLGADQMADATGALGGGAIEIHQVK